MAEESISLAEAQWRRCSPPGWRAFTEAQWREYERLADALIASISFAEAALAGNPTAGERAVIGLRLKAAAVVLEHPAQFARALGGREADVGRPRGMAAAPGSA